MQRQVQVGLAILLILAALGACQEAQPAPQAGPGTASALQVASSAFEDQGTIPERFTCDAEDLNPPLSWSEPPAGTQSLALIFDDPDAPNGTWDHWLLFNIPPAIRSLPEGIPPDAVVEGVGTQGSNGWHRLGYGGPCPPKGSIHRYFFRLYALDTLVNLGSGAGKDEITKAMQGHVLAEGALMGRYGR